MRASSIKANLEVVTNVAVLVACVALLSAISWGYFAQRKVLSVKAGLRKGDTIVKPQDLNVSSSPQTLLIALDTQCHFCADGIAFYNRLEAASRGPGGRPRCSHCSQIRRMRLRNMSANTNFTRTHWPQWIFQT